MIDNKKTSNEKSTHSEKLLTAMVLVLYLGGLVLYCDYMVRSVNKALKKMHSEKTIPVPKQKMSTIYFASQDFIKQR